IAASFNLEDQRTKIREKPACEWTRPSHCEVNDGQSCKRRLVRLNTLLCRRPFVACKWEVEMRRSRCLRETERSSWHTTAFSIDRQSGERTSHLEDRMVEDAGRIWNGNNGNAVLAAKRSPLFGIAACECHSHCSFDFGKALK